MRASQARFVTACQQLLALAVVLAVLTPAAGVVSIDIVRTAPAGRPSGDAAVQQQAAELAAYARQASAPAPVATAPVDPRVSEIQMTAPRGGETAMSRPLEARSMAAGDGRTRVVSRPQSVIGYGTVGVTWDRAAEVEDHAISLQARTRTDGRWSAWSDIEYHGEHAPDPGSVEARRARPGSDPLVIGRVRKVQVRTTTAGAPPADMRLALVDPGRAAGTKTDRPAIDAASLPSSRSLSPTSAAAAVYTPMPGIFSRAQWGADERGRDAGSLRYYEVHAGFVHHTVNSNNYSEADVPGIIRSIYAYHTKSRGWSDIGYNFLVDRFGRVWEGRYGGVDRPVVGAHTLGYNDYSFAMSAIGNFETAQPSDAVLRAYGAVFAWKLSLHGVAAASPSQRVGRSTFQAINGHRDAGQTACPGRHLYAQLPTIRSYAAAGQVGWAGRERESNLVGSPHPDIVVRRAGDARAFVIPTQGSGAPLGEPVDTGWNLTDANALLNVGDWDRDGFGDFMARSGTDGGLYLFRGNGQGQFAAPVLVGAGFRGVRLLAAVGDVTGDGWPDLMGQPRKAAMRIYPGVGMGGFAASYVAYSKIKARRQVGIGRMDADGAPDSIFRRKKNLVLYRGNGPGGLTAGATKVRGRLRGFDWVIGVSDIDVSGHPDVLLRKKKDGSLYLLPGNERRFGKPVRLGGGMAGYDLAG
jgi:N-acetylmuramoyl-L-alanine amidase-like protein/VCBS repeat protein